MTPIEKMSAIIAAVGHDLDHPGLNEKFLITTSSHLAGLYNNTSVLENHHWRTCVALMHEAGLSSVLSAADRQECDTIIQSMVLATDISRQGDFLRQLGQYLDHEVPADMSVMEYRRFMLQIALKCADISNPCRTWNISRLWSYRACEEFYRQGDRESELNLPVTPICDRNGISVAKVRISRVVFPVKSTSGLYFSRVVFPVTFISGIYFQCHNIQRKLLILTNFTTLCRRTNRGVVSPEKSITSINFYPQFSRKSE